MFDPSQQMAQAAAFRSRLAQQQQQQQPVVGMQGSPMGSGQNLDGTARSPMDNQPNARAMSDQFLQQAQAQQAQGMAYAQNIQPSDFDPMGAQRAQVESMAQQDTARQDAMRGMQGQGPMGGPPTGTLGPASANTPLRQDITGAQQRPGVLQGMGQGMGVSGVETPSQMGPAPANTSLRQDIMGSMGPAAPSPQAIPSPAGPRRPVGASSATAIPSAGGPPGTPPAARQSGRRTIFGVR